MLVKDQLLAGTWAGVGSHHGTGWGKGRGRLEKGHAVVELERLVTGQRLAMLQAAAAMTSAQGHGQFTCGRVVEGDLF